MVKSELDVTRESQWPPFTYDQARAAFDAGQKLHYGGRVYLVRPGLREPAEDLLWITDERTPGDHGLLLYADGRIEIR